MQELVRVLCVETPSSLTPEEVYEMVLEWLREKEIADGYLRPQVREGNTPGRSWTHTRRLRQVEVVESARTEDDCFWTVGSSPGPRQVN